MKKVEVRIKYKGDKDINSWGEIYEVNNEVNPEVFGKALIDRFNESLKPGEKGREFVGVRDITDGTFAHQWEKSNACTIIRGSQNYDTMRCKVCGITGKRYGLSSGVTRDSQYRAKVYETCTGASMQILKIRERRVNNGE